MGAMAFNSPLVEDRRDFGEVLVYIMLKLAVCRHLPRSTVVDNGHNHPPGQITSKVHTDKLTSPCFNVPIPSAQHHRLTSDESVELLLEEKDITRLIKTS